MVRSYLTVALTLLSTHAVPSLGFTPTPVVGRIGSQCVASGFPMSYVATTVIHPRRVRAKGRSCRWEERGHRRGWGSERMAASQDLGLGDYFKVPDERILKAVEKAGNRAVVPDVATLAGVDLTTAQTGLVNLATLVGGDLEVSKDGDLVYSFPRDFRGVLRQRSAYQRGLEAFRKAWPSLFYGVRVGFGLVLLASIVLVFSTIFFVATASSSSSDERDSRRRPGTSMGMMDMGMYWGPSPFDFLYYRPYYGYYNTPRNIRGDNPEEMGLLESTFSYIFGDGDPNKDLPERRIQAASELIRENGGVITAEQLAPLLEPGGPRQEESTNVDESFVLPVLTALDGRPELTEDGDIVYLFPSLQTSAMGPEDRLAGLKASSTAELIRGLDSVGIYDDSVFERDDLVNTALLAGLSRTPSGEVKRSAIGRASSSKLGAARIPQPLEEEQRPFSVAATWKKIAAGVLGVVNLGGALYLSNLLNDPYMAGVQLPGYFGFVQGALPFLVAYAVAFNTIPLVRWLLNKRENEAIVRRNNNRRMWAALARSGGGATVARKLAAAKALTTKLRVVKKEDVTYTTSKTLAEQGVEDDLLSDFDKRLKSSPGDSP